MEERGRIARDLHDHVIQRLFAAGLGLEAVASVEPSQRDALQRQVEQIDRAIADIRTAVFALSRPSETETLRDRVLRLVDDISPGMPSRPRVSFGGPVDTLITDDLLDDVVAVARKALTNVARHAAALTCTVAVTADDQRVSVVVEDDGSGLTAENDRRSGMANMQKRAHARGGTCEFTRARRRAGHALVRPSQPGLTSASPTDFGPVARRRSRAVWGT